MARNTLTLPAKADKPAVTKYIVQKFIYTEPNAYPLPIGAVKEFADSPEVENLVSLGFLRRADDESASNAKIISANPDLRPATAMPPSPPLTQFPYNPASPPKA
jgi:hypothetical protein